MSLSNEIINKVENYLDGNMSAKELADFETQINSNQELFEYISLNKQMRLIYNENTWAFKTNNVENVHLNRLNIYFESEQFINDKKIINNINSKFKNRIDKRKLLSRYYIRFSIAASIVLLMGYFIINNSSNTNDFYLKYNNWDDLPSLNSRNEINNLILINGEEAFLNKQYVEAEKYFSYFIKNEERINSTVLIYLGISQLELNKLDESVNTFDDLINSNTLDSSKGYWYKTLIYLKNNEKRKAVSQLEIILKNPNNFNYLEAKLLIKEIK